MAEKESNGASLSKDYDYASLRAYDALLKRKDGIKGTWSVLNNQWMDIIFTPR
jgi:hypothetical protein